MNVRRVLLLVIALLALLLISHAGVGKDGPKPKDGPGKDYKSELPRIAPKTPAEALKSFGTRPGFRVDLIAAEPLLRDPVALDFDEDGRMFVVEYPEYNQYANKDFKGHGVVRLLEDSDGDGRYDKSTVYVDRLNSATAVACYDGGVFVGAVPDILYCKDTDGDGKADVRRVVFTGFARDHAGEAMLNSFRWGLDNRIHVSTSLAGGDIRRPDKKDAKPISVRGQHFLFDPRTLAFEATSGGGQHGMSMDDWGRTFVCGNSDPIHLILYDGRYLARNPYLKAPAAAVNIAPGGKYTRVYRISKVEPWRTLRTRLRSQGVVPGSDEGGKPAGFFTGATGVTIYRGDAWPEEYHGNVFVGEVSGNFVHRARLKDNGVSLTAKRADKDVEFLASTDVWFRPVQFANAPDGTLYVLDMYRELIEGAAFLPPEILKHLDVSSGIDRGRLYRIAPEKFKQPRSPRLSRATTKELVALLEHRNGWHRDTAARLLYQRQDSVAVPLLKQLADGSRLPQGRLHALYALDGLKALGMEDVLRGLKDEDGRVREHALRLAEKVEAAPQVRARLEQMTEDVDRRVRYQLAFSLGAVRGGMRPRALARLAVRDGSDSWVRLGILSSVNDIRGEVFRLLAGDRAFRATPVGRQFLGTLAAQVGLANRKPEVAALLRSLDSLPESEKSLTQEVVRQFVAGQPATVREQLTRTGGRAGTVLAGLLADARKTASAGERSAQDRATAIRTLGLSAFSDIEESFGKLLDRRQPQPVQAAVLETLAHFDSLAVATMVLKAWPGLSPQLRATAAETLFARPAWVMRFLDAVEGGGVGRGDVDPARVVLLRSHADEKVRTRAKKLFARSGPSRRQDVVAEYQKALKLAGDVERGRMVFRKQCIACHKLEGVGESIGADLAAIRNRGAEAVLLNVLDPNREVKPQFLTYSLTTDRGRAITGMIAAETASSLSIRRADGTSETVLRVQIEELRSTGMSFMPEGLEKLIDVQAMADLLAYLNSIK